MALVPVRYEELEDVTEVVIRRLQAARTAKERQFLVSLKEGAPQWDLLGLPGIDQLPGLQWKLANIRQMDKGKHAQMIGKLRRVLDL